MPKKQYKNIEAIVEEMEPDKRYVVFIDKRFIDYDDMELLRDLFEKRSADNGSVAVVGNGDPADMVHFRESRNWGEAATYFQDWTQMVIWPLPNYTGVNLADVDLDEWAKRMVTHYAEKVDEARVSLKLKQEEQTDAAQ